MYITKVFKYSQYLLIFDDDNYKLYTSSQDCIVTAVKLQFNSPLHPAEHHYLNVNIACLF